MTRALVGFVLSVTLLVGPAARAARAATVDDLVNLKANGLSDDVLIALVQTDGSLFHLSSDDILAIRQRGLTDAVILAMVMTAKQPPAPRGEDPAAAVVQPTPVVVSVTNVVVQQVEPTRQQTRTVYVPVAVPVVVPVAVDPPKAPEPVYWGFGGQRRPDTWQDPASGNPAHPPASGQSAPK